MSGTLKVNLPELADAIEAEEGRLAKRPVPTAPWSMPLTLDDLRAFVETVECARDLVEYLGPDGNPDQRYYVARLEVALQAFTSARTTPFQVSSPAPAAPFFGAGGGPGGVPQ